MMCTAAGRCEQPRLQPIGRRVFGGGTWYYWRAPSGLNALSPAMLNFLGDVKRLFTLDATIGRVPGRAA